MPPRVQLRAPGALADRAAAVLGLAGVAVTDDAAVGLLLSAGPPDPSVSDDWLVSAVPHLAVSVSTARVRLGPFVVPGGPACLRCLAVTAEEDGYGDHPAPCDGEPDAASVGLASTLAARELRVWAAGRRPATWSATVTVEPDLATYHRRWPRHPRCGCDWGEAV